MEIKIKYIDTASIDYLHYRAMYFWVVLFLDSRILLNELNVEKQQKVVEIASK